MSTFRGFEEIEAWRKARELTKKIYTVSSRGMFSKDFALRDQVRRACISVMSNIAEGLERGGTKEFRQFLSIAKGSIAEARSQIYVAQDQGYLSEVEARDLLDNAAEVARMLYGLMKYLQKTNIKGTKYK